jgi:hypothetical protein
MLGISPMKSVIAVAVSFAVLSMSSVAVAAPEKVVRSDRISFNVVKANQEKKVERIARTDRIQFNTPMFEKSSVKPQRVARTDRVVFNKI